MCALISKIIPQKTDVWSLRNCIQDKVVAIKFYLRKILSFFFPLPSGNIFTYHLMSLCYKADKPFTERSRLLTIAMNKAIQNMV